MSNTIRCSSCGEPNPEGAAFCGDCGRKLEISGDAGTQTSELAVETGAEAPPLSRASPSAPEGAGPSPAAATQILTPQLPNPVAAPPVKTNGSAATGGIGSTQASPPVPVPAPPVPATSPAIAQKAAGKATAATGPVTAPIPHPGFILYEYHMCQIPPAIQVKGAQRGQEAAQYLADICNRFAGDGWEFFRVDSISVAQAPGCLGVLFGGGNKSVPSLEYYVITFRRPKRS